MANGEQRTAHDRRLVWLLIAAGLVGLWNCGVQDHGLILSPPEWKDGERAGYEIVRNDSVVYRTWLKVELSEEVAGVQGIRIPTVVVTSMVEPGEGGEYFFDSLTVVLRRDSLRPLRSYRSITSGVSELEVEARFDPGRAVITKTTVDGVQQGSVGLPK
ncbi:MAG: hypothetical protein ABIK37_06055, partial [candidate division WOR-3 bacterium]